jgi:hypothetical protein
VIHPNDELGLACAGGWSDASARREYPACMPAGTPVYQPVQPDDIYDDTLPDHSPAVRRSPASNQPEYTLLVLPSPPLPPTRPGEPLAPGAAAVETARPPRGLRPSSPQAVRSRSASTEPGLRSRPSKVRPHSGLHTAPTGAAAMARAPRAIGGWCCGGGGGSSGGSGGSSGGSGRGSGGGGAFRGGSGQPLRWPLRDGVQSAPTQRPPLRHAAWMLP